MEIQWEEPPAEVIIRSRAAGAKYIDFAVELRNHKDRWAVLPLEQPYGNLSSAQSAAQNIRRGITKAFAPKGSYDAVAGAPDKIWVRFLGEPEVAPPANPANPADPTEDDEKSLAPKIRAWARENDIPVPERGRLPESVIQQYCDVTGAPRPRHLRSAN